MVVFALLISYDILIFLKGRMLEVAAVSAGDSVCVCLHEVVVVRSQSCLYTY